VQAVRKTVLIHYHEISLKGNNRGWFENRLFEHVQALLRDLPHAGVRRVAGRMQVSLSPESPEDEIRRRLSRTFGVANFAIAWEIPAALDSMQAALQELIPNCRFQSFKIDTRRGTKDFPLNSRQVNETLGAFVQTLTGAAVRMENPDLVFFVEIVGRQAFIYHEKFHGGGGLPAGTGGKVLCLLSGGIDSPVAAYRLMRRGCRVLFAHFHSFPHTTLESQDKVRRILQRLSQYQLECKLFLVPFAEVQREIVAYSPPGLRVILYRRFMIRIAEAIASREKAAALVTGDSLGQVASQTLSNLRTVSAAASLPIFRPLIGDDKEDIIRIARDIGTYELSILPDEDCCTMFVPKHPETSSSVEQVERAEGALDVPRLVKAAMAAANHETITPTTHQRDREVAETAQ
jgi:tRNA uracil 4-sulfurtransferase